MHRHVHTHARARAHARTHKERERERERERDDNTFLCKDKDLSTSRLFYRSVPDDKCSNTQYIKQDYKNYGKMKYD